MSSVSTDKVEAHGETGAGKGDFKRSYLLSLKLIGRLHRRLLDVIKDELDRLDCGDINSVQALLLSNIGESELTAGELRTRGHYLGSNVSYNLKKLVEAGYINHQRSRADKRAVRVSLTDRGQRVCDIVESLYDRHVHVLESIQDINLDELHSINATLKKLERFWTDQIRYRL
jgi:DNA-binding MarR family transcriptional regulator